MIKPLFHGAVFIITILFATSIQSCKTANVRSTVNFCKDWRFNLGDEVKASNPDFDDSKWRSLDLPHDWSIEGTFDEKNPATTAGGSLPGGIGWYRKSFTVNPSQKNKCIFIDFDGVYCNSEVWINGHYLGLRPYGYSSFRYQLTPFLKYGKDLNVIAVKVDNSKQSNSRWYSGSGIYRNVWLVMTEKIMVDHWGTFVTTPVVNKQSAEIIVRTRVRNYSPDDRTITIKTIIYNKKNKKVENVVSESEVLKDSVNEVVQKFNIQSPELWSLSDPVLYKAVSSVIVRGKVTDKYTTSFGIRSFVFDTDQGFLLNGEKIKINGVCDHHDLGCLGSAVNKRAIERQLELLKKMGCNGIRTSHNPPAPELLDLADKMGFIVMDEAFDMWLKPKNQFDYHLYFKQWHKQDLEDMVLRDRNHPSVFIWSIGNEIPEQGDSTGITIARDLAGIVRNLDTSRPITSALTDPNPSTNFLIKSGALDLIGINYNFKSFPNFKNTFPGKKIICTESVSAFETRGSYDMPSDSIRRWPLYWDKPFTSGNPDYSCSSYDNCASKWGSTHEETWKVIKANDFISGMFIWTGFDYIGEPTPYPWPAVSSYFGILDLAGFPKDAFYLYQSEWTKEPVLHLLPHWNWEKGKVIDVWAYYNNADEVELFLNGKSQGIKKKQGEDLHVCWRLTYEPGILKAISRKNGVEVLTDIVKTAGKPAQIILSADRSTMTANGNDLIFITAKVLDSDSTLVPSADNLITFTVEGAASIAGVDNGNQISHEAHKANYRKAFHGMCLAVIKSKEKPGQIRITANAEGLKPGSVSFNSVR